MINKIDSQLKNKMLDFIDTDLKFKNPEEKSQFLELIEPVMNNEVTDGDLIKMRFKNKNFFTKIISKFELNHDFFAYKTFSDKYLNKAPLFVLWFRSFRNTFLTLVFLSFLYSFSGKDMLNFIINLLPYILVISSVWGIKETFIPSYYFNNHEEIRIKFLNKYAKNSFIAQFVYLLDKYKKPLSKQFINTTKEEILAESGSQKAIESKFQSNIINGNVYALNSLSITRNNLMNLKRLISFSNQEFYKDREDLKNEEDAKKIVSKL